MTGLVTGGAHGYSLTATSSMNQPLPPWWALLASRQRSWIGCCAAPGGKLTSVTTQPPESPDQARRPPKGVAPGTNTVLYPLAAKEPPASRISTNGWAPSAISSTPPSKFGSNSKEWRKLNCACPVIVENTGEYSDKSLALARSGAKAD